MTLALSGWLTLWQDNFLDRFLANPTLVDEVDYRPGLADHDMVTASCAIKTIHAQNTTVQTTVGGNCSSYQIFKALESRRTSSWQTGVCTSHPDLERKINHLLQNKCPHTMVCIHCNVLDHSIASYECT